MSLVSFKFANAIEISNEMSMPDIRTIFVKRLYIINKSEILKNNNFNHNK